jgi:NTP pyrophosphatase (non-canonical NTP hydrolase)
MTSTGLVAGEVKDMYDGEGPDNESIKKHLVDIVQSVSQLSSIFEISLSEVVELAFKEKD